MEIRLTKVAKKIKVVNQAFEWLNFKDFLISRVLINLCENCKSLKLLNYSH